MNWMPLVYYICGFLSAFLVMYLVYLWDEDNAAEPHTAKSWHSIDKVSFHTHFPMILEEEKTPVSGVFELISDVIASEGQKLESTLQPGSYSVQTEVYASFTLREPGEDPEEHSGTSC